MNPQIAVVAAKWWADMLRKSLPSNISGTGQDGLVNTLKANLTKATPNTPESIDRFEATLEARLWQRLPKTGYIYDHIFVDYSPMVFLEDVANEVGVRLNGLPAKVDMYIFEKEIKVQTSSQSLKVIWAIE